MSQSGPLNIRNASNTVTSLQATAPLTANGVSGTPEVGDVIVALTTPLATGYGGTGQSTYTNGQLLIGNTATNTLDKSTLTAGTGISISNGGGSITITNTDPGSAGVTSLTGTANEVLVNGTSGTPTTGAITLTTPQAIGTASNVQFAKVTAGEFDLIGSGSGTISILPQSAAGTYNFNLPITAGTTGYFLTSAGGGAAAMTWTNPATSLVTSIAGTANQIAVSLATGAVTLSLTNGISLGSYQAIAPPTGGALIPGQVAIGQSTVTANNQLTVNSTLAHIYTSRGTQTGVDAQSHQHAYQANGGMNPTGGAALCATYSAETTFGANLAQTITAAADYHSSPDFSANAGTISSFAGFFFDGGTGASGTLPVVYGCYLTNPTVGTLKFAAYMDNLAVGSNTTAPPSLGATIKGQTLVQYGGVTFSLAATPSIVLGTSNTLAGAIKLWGTTGSAYSLIQSTTTNLHLDSNNGGTSAVYLNHYAVAANTYIQDAGGQIGLGTLTPTSGAVVTISGANATTSTRRSLYVIAPTGGGSSNQAIYADDVTIGYTTGQPATNGLLVSGISSIGTTVYENCRLTISNAATDYYDLYLKGTLISYDAGQVVTALYSAAQLNPTLGASVAASIYSYNAFIAPTAQTITLAAPYFANPYLALNVGTITTVGEFTANGGTGTAGTITNHIGFYAKAMSSGTNRYGGYFTAPSAGTIAAAIYADNIAIGSTVTPASSTGLTVAGKVTIGTNTLQIDSLSNDLQLGVIGTTKGMSIAMTNVYARMREVGTVNKFTITTNFSISPSGQDNATYNSWLYSMLSGATTTGFCRWDYSPPGTTATTTYMNLSSDPVLAVGTLSYVANTAIPFQCSALLTTDTYFGANKAGATAALFGFSNGNGSFGTATIVRCVTTDPIDVFVNNTSRSVRFDSSQRVLTTGTVGLNYGTTTTGMLSTANCDSLATGSQAGYLSTVYLSGASNANGYYMRQARGSQASPTATTLNDALGNIFAQGYGATGFSAFATGLTFYAEQTFTDTANGAGMIFYSTLTGTAVLNTAFQISANGNVVCGGANGAAISTSATYGFFYIPTCAGTPTGIPESYTGRVGMVFDPTSNKLWIYNSGWKSATFV